MHFFLASIKTRPTGSKTTKALLYACVADHSDGRVSSVQLGNASAPVKPASCLINSSYCLSILSALLTSTRTTLFPHLRSLLTSSFRIYPFTVHQSGLQGPYRRGLSKMTKAFLLLLKKSFAKVEVFHFYMIIIYLILSLRRDDKKNTN